MTTTRLLHLRLANQQLSGHGLTRPDALVARMGCIQAQDFAAAKWAIGSRLGNTTDAGIEQLFNEGRILRTHILRPTWHFVAPEDILWMLRLTAPKIKAFNKNLHRKLGITNKALIRSKNILVKALEGGRQLTRAEIVPLLKRAKINTDDIRLSFLLMDAELDGILCSGGRRGKQFTYALLEERVAARPYPGPEAAIAELAKRYFMSRGPATLPDFAWWSGLNISQAKKGIEAIRHRLAHEVIKGQAYWFSPEIPDTPRPHRSLHLLPAFDEYAIAYKDRSEILPPHHYQQAGNGIFRPTIILNGRVAGTWKRTESKEKVAVEAHLFAPLNGQAQKQLKTAIGEYARFMDKEGSYTQVL